MKDQILNEYSTCFTLQTNYRELVPPTIILVMMPRKKRHEAAAHKSFECEFFNAMLVFCCFKAIFKCSSLERPLKNVCNLRVSRRRKGCVGICSTTKGTGNREYKK